MYANKLGWSSQNNMNLTLTNTQNYSLQNTMPISVTAISYAVYLKELYKPTNSFHSKLMEQKMHLQLHKFIYYNCCILNSRLQDNTS